MYSDITLLLVPGSTFLLSCHVWKRIVFAFRNPFLFFFSPGDVTESILMAPFFCVAWKTKKSLFSNWHAAVYQWLPQRRIVQGRVFMLSLASKTSSSSMSLPLIWCGLLVISSMESNHTELLYWFWSLLISFFKDYACEEFTLYLFRKQRALSIPCRLSNS